MVYGVCYCPKKREKDLTDLGAADSKTLTEAKREELFKIIHNNNDYIGWSLEVISPMYISNCMYERNKISLNEVSQNSAAQLIRRVIDKGANIAEVYVDTVGDPQKYQSRLQDIFPTLNITVSKKADSLFPCVSAASICAKVARDRALLAWKFPEGIHVDSWGSGYPGDSVTKNFLINSLDPVFGFPALVRFSWSTAEKIAEDKCVQVKWLHEEEEEEKAESTPSILQFFAKKRKASDHEEEEEETKANNNNEVRRNFYFSDRCLRRIEAL
ncbi:UNVERIFIED_CONTAM: hypothetical protein GTU68_021526 [Idotea baltica]|nr:hypothetical protein [Idotea baltica]